MLIQGLIDGLTPVKRITVSEWSNEYRYLSNVASARPGKYDIWVTPYLKDIADDLSEVSEVQEVIFMKAAQIGATEVGNNWIGYIIHIAPYATLMLMPTDDTVKTNSQIRIDPMINDTPELKKRIGEARSRDSKNTINQKSFPNGVLIMRGANSPVAMRSLPIKNIMLDELDGYPANIGGEGSAMKLAKARTRTYTDIRKIFAPSTPTLDGTSQIQKEYENSDQRKYFVPCPHCGTPHILEWANMKWETGKPETAYMQCPECGDKIEEKHKIDIIRDGFWKATNPDFHNKRRRGYHLSALYSTLGYTWAEAVNDYLDGLKDENDMVTFVNTVLGEVYKATVEVPDWKVLHDRKSDSVHTNKLQKDVAFLTCGVDVQQNRLELEIVGWCKNKKSYGVDYRVIPGDTSGPKVWEELDKLLGDKFEREDGAVLPITMMAIDTGYNSTDVYEFCRNYDAGRVIPVDGRDNLHATVGIPRQIDINRDGKKIGSIMLWAVGVSTIKTELYGWLRQSIKEDGSYPTGYCIFPYEYEPRYFQMLVSEQKQIVIGKDGKRKYQWVLPSHTRNEALDCRVYARAAASVIGMDRWTDEDWDIQAASWPTKDDLKLPQKNDAPDEHEDDWLGDTNNWL